MAITATCMSAAIPDVLHRLRHAECDDQAAFDVILIEKRRRDRDLTGADELFDQADELDQQVFLATLPILFHLVVNIAGLHLYMVSVDKQWRKRIAAFGGPDLRKHPSRRYCSQSKAYPA